METMTAQQAIEASINEDRIVRLHHANGGDAFVEALNTLSAECDDNVSYVGPEEDGTYIYEYWGDQDGEEWRVHVIGPRRY